MARGNISAIGFVPQDKGGFVVSKDLELVGKEGVELVEENFETTEETEDGNNWDGKTKDVNKWDETYETNDTAWN